MLPKTIIPAALIIGLTSALVPVARVNAAPLLPPINIQTFTTHSDPEVSSAFQMASANEAGGASVAVADLGEDGTPEIIIGNGFGNSPLVHVLRKDGSEVGSFLAYAPDMGSGVNVAVCDVNGDGQNDIVTAPGRGGGPHVRAFTSMGNPMGNGGTFAYAEGFRGGVNLACGDLDGDGKDEVVTLPGPGGGPHVRVWDVVDGALTLQKEFFAFDAAHRAGLVGVVHSGILHVASQRAAHDKTLKTFSLASAPEPTSSSTLSYDASGINSLFFVDEDLFLATTSNAHLLNTKNGHVTFVDAPFDSLAAASGDLDGDGDDEILTSPTRPIFFEQDAAHEQSVVVDISDQRIFAYEYGVLTHTFLVSTARPGYTTPRGTHSVLAKPYLVHYSWSYSPGNPNNYDLGFVPYNLRIYPHIYIHYAPWHNNFGRVISHGCINVALDNIKWIYGWAQVGDQVVVRD